MAPLRTTKIFCLDFCVSLIILRLGCSAPLGAALTRLKVAGE